MDVGAVFRRTVIRFARAVVGTTLMVILVAGLMLAAAVAIERLRPDLFREAVLASTDILDPHGRDWVEVGSPDLIWAAVADE